MSVKIKDLRKEKGITLKELSKNTGLSQGYLSQLENELKTPKLETIWNIAIGLDVPFEDLLMVYGYIDSPIDKDVYSKDLDRMKAEYNKLEIENEELRSKLLTIRNIANI